MGRAHTDEEREEIRNRLLEAGLDLYHDNNVKRLSIAAVTKRAGIAQGGFYSYFRDKEDLIAEIMVYRTRQKMDGLRQQLDRSLADPAGFLAGTIFAFTVDMKKKADEKKMYRDLGGFLGRNTDGQKKVLDAIDAFLMDLDAYWREAGLAVSMDRKGVINVILADCLVSGHADLMDPGMFEEILQAGLDAAIRNYVKTEVREE